ncbi:hypothetical protein [Nocardioides jensenii]|uniref:hypothetical protein n=1 Tax=Nocardioides jensenii TaxID=1843 RepID=UPI00082C3BF6|nr:hypothetical protein [Nocardioides jensenii]
MSQIPSAATLRSRRSRDRYAHCPICPSSDVDGNHVDRCQDSKRYRDHAVQAASAASVPEVTASDLWAHLNSRTHNELISANVVQLVLDLGWRPVVGSDPARLWSADS